MTNRGQTATWDDPAAPNVFVARQPIMRTDSTVAGYELLYRSPLDPHLVDRNPRAATGHVLATALFSIGLERLVGASRAWINFPRSWLIDGVIGVLPHDRVVLEVLESVHIDDDLLGTCTTLKERGFTLALDRFEPNDEREPLLKLADYVKVDIGHVGEEHWGELLTQITSSGATPVAERVEDWFDLDKTKKAGFELFQGYYLTRPHIVTGTEVPVLDSTRLMAVQVAANERSTLDDVERIVAGDAGLAFRLLRYLNAASFGFRDPISNVRQAVIKLGDRGARTWLLLATIHALGKGRPLELIAISAIRARMCERLALASGREHLRDDVFMAGLFFNIDAITGMPMEEVLEAITLPPDVAAALVGQPAHELGDILGVAVAYQTGMWDQVEQLTTKLGISQTLVADEYVKSIDWARQALSF
jgi:EAL and modified HD-GYP domain-containing signal transduction protein